MLPRTIDYYKAHVFSIEQLQFKQRKGELLTREDKERLKKYAEERRKKNLHKK